MSEPPRDGAYDVAALSDLEEGIPQTVKLRGREVLVVSWRGCVYALRNVCPHQSRLLGDGAVRDGITSGERLGDVTVDERHPVIACPWHGFEYDLQSGVCVVDPGLRVRSYPTELRAGRVLVHLDGK